MNADSIENLCRICRKITPFNSIHIQSSHDGIPVSEMLSKTVPIDISFDDPLSELLPQYICTDCFEIIVAVFNLQQVCIESDSYFRSVLGTDVMVKKEVNEDVVVKEEMIEYPDFYDDWQMEAEEDVLNESKPKKVKGSGSRRRYRKKPNFFCDICGDTCNGKIELKNHMVTIHLGKESIHKSFKCNYCPARFSRRDRLNVHLLRRHNERTKCEKCEAELNDHEERQKHMLSVHEKLFRELAPYEKQQIIKCCKCEFEFKNEPELMQHLVVHLEFFSKEDIKCLFCKTIMKNYKHFCEHSQYHAKPLTHECLVCKKLMPMDDVFMRHVIRHRKRGSCSLPCGTCGLKFVSEKRLQQHVNSKHGPDSLFICPICARSLGSQNGLGAHLRYVHSTEKDKKFQCKFCPAKFNFQAKLRKHEATHSTERPHVCDICGSSFKLPHGLRKHLKIHDPNREKKYECSQCDFKFPEKYKLEQHMLTHTGLKPHECKFCDRAYASKGDLVKHMQKLHVGDAIYQCDKCSKGFRLMVELREHQQEHAQWIRD